MKRKGCGRKHSWPTLRHCPGICLVLRKITKTLIWDSRFDPGASRIRSRSMHVCNQLRDYVASNEMRGWFTSSKWKKKLRRMWLQNITNFKRMPRYIFKSSRPSPFILSILTIIVPAHRSSEDKKNNPQRKLMVRSRLISTHAHLPWAGFEYQAE